jgi:hypothetical protein
MRVASISKRLALRLLMAFTAGLISGFAAHIIDAQLAVRGLTAHSTFVDDCLTGLFVGTIAFCLSLYLDERNDRQHTRHRVLAVAEMNHHLRNALAVLKLSPEIEDSSARRRAIESGIARIEFTLEEILPSSFDRRGEPRYFIGPQHKD